MKPNENSVHFEEERVHQNIFSLCTQDMFEKANSNADTLESLRDFKNFELIENLFLNYKKIFVDVFPKNNLLVLNHNDVHRLNILKNINDGELMILDHEYAGLNLIGVDIVNYLIESNFDYTKKEYPFFSFNNQPMDLENYFSYFQKFLEDFEIANAEELQNETFRKKVRKG